MNGYKKYVRIRDPNSPVLTNLPFKPGQVLEVVLLAEERYLTQSLRASARRLRMRKNNSPLRRI